MHQEKMKRILSHIVQKEEKDTEDVYREMMWAIDMAFESNGESDLWESLFGKDKPTPEEFIEVIAGKVQ